MNAIMNKFDKAQKILQDLDADGWLIVCNEDSDINSRFMLGVESHALHYVYVSAKGEHEVVAVEMEAPMIKRSLENKGVEVNMRTYNSMTQLKSQLKPIIDKNRIALNYGENVLENDGTYYADYIRAGDYSSIRKLVPDTDLISAAPIIYGLRSIKSQEQLNDLRNTCKVTLELLEQIPDWCKIGMTERELQAKLEYEYMKLGRPSFPAIIASGPHSADPHHNTSTKKIHPGVLLIDTGLILDEMCSDITWTYWIQGEPSEDFIKAYNALYNSKIEANKYMIDGTPNCVPAIKCRESLEKEGYDHEKLYFHGFGHSLGFEAHDIGERISWKVPENNILRENMVYTNEPGLYWREKWGIRLEDDVIIGKEQCEVVTYIPKDPMVI
jgi:Xaa-Pro aminopeptidase